MVSFAFPPVEADTTNAQIQAIAAIRGLAVNDDTRLSLVKLGCCEPLILVAGDASIQTIDIQIRREAAAALFNLALSKKNSILMAQSGIVGALSSLMKGDDGVAQVFAVGTLANLAEKGYAVQSKLLQDGCLLPLVRTINYTRTAKETQKEVARCLALFSNEGESHESIICEESLQCILHLIRVESNIQCSRFASLAFANLALPFSNHGRVVRPIALDSLAPLLSLKDIQTYQCTAFALHNVCKNEHMHPICLKSNIACLIARLLSLEDSFAKLHACLALRYFSTSKMASAQFIECKGLPELFQLAIHGDLEMKVEAVACLRNISLSDPNKVHVLREGGLPILTDLSRSQDTRLAHQACAVVANLAEVPANQEKMLSDGVLHHLRFALRSESNEVNREALRSLCNLSSDSSSTYSIPKAGLLIPLIHSLSSDEMLCRRFASIAISNLATNRSVQARLVEEGAIDPLFFITSQREIEDIEARRYAFNALSNIASHKIHHNNLLRCDIVQQSLGFLKNSDRHLKSSAALFLCNLASNPQTHESLRTSDALEEMQTFLHHGQRHMQLCAASFIRGVSTSTVMRSSLIQPGMSKTLLKLAVWKDVEIQKEILAAMCNLSLSGNIGDDPDSFLEEIQIGNLLSFLCKADSVYRLFGAVVIGNIASEERLQATIVNGGAILKLIHTANAADSESKRCIAYAICNLCTDPSNRAKIVKEGGLLPVLSLASSGHSSDVLAALMTIRALSCCGDIRRLIVQCGGLEPLMFTCCGDNCERRNIIEACHALCWLSLEDENKTSIVKHKQFSTIMRVSASHDVNIKCALLHILSNCSEKMSLQPTILKVTTLPFFDSLFDQDLSKTAPELSRLVSNLCSMHENHSMFLNQKMLTRILTLSRSQHSSVRSSAVISLLNIASNQKAHQAMIPFGKVVVEAIFQACDPNDVTTDSTKIKRYAYSTLGCLLINSHYHHLLLSSGVSDLLQKELKDDDGELVFIATFALHQLLKNDRGLECCKDLNTEISLIRIIQNMKPCYTYHAVSCLRYLSINRKIASNIVAQNGLKSLHFALDQASVEIEREIVTIAYHLTTYSELRVLIVKSLLFQSVLRFCESVDSEASRFALGALANSVECPSTHNHLYDKIEKIVQMLTRVMESKAMSRRREACRAISNLLSFDTATDVFLKIGGLHSINTIFRCIDYEIQYSLSLSLRKLASRTSNHDLIIKSGGLRIILHICNLPNNVDATRQAMIGLRDLASNREMKMIIANEGGMKTASSLLDCDDFATSSASAAVLQHLTLSSRIKWSLYENGILFPLCQQIILSDNSDFSYHAGYVLSNLAESVKIRQLMWHRDVVSALLALTQKNIHKIHVQVARCICFMSTSQNIYKNLRKEIIEIALKLMASKNQQIANDAVTAIGNFANDTDGQLMLGDLKAFGPIVALIGVTNEVTKCSLSCCWALSRFVIPVKNKVLCAVRTPLFTYLTDLCCENQINDCVVTSMAFCNIAVYKVTHSLILQSGGVTVLLTLLQSCCHEVVLSSLKALCNLCTSAAARQEVVNDNGIIVLLRLVLQKDMVLKEHSILTLCNLCISLQCSKLVSAIGGVEIISDLLSYVQIESIREASALIVYNISRNDECHQGLAKRTTLKALVHLCKSRVDNCRQRAMMTLCNLAANDLTRVLTRQNGTMQIAIVMLKDKCPGCRTYASLCLTNLMNEKKTQSQVVLHGALPGVVDSLSDEDDDVRRSALLCLVNIAGKTSNHNALLSHDVMNTLNELWENETSTEMKAFVSCVFVNLVSNDVILDIVGGHGGINILMSLSSSINFHCQCAGTAGLRHLAVTPKNRARLLHAQVTSILNVNGHIDEVDIQREVAGCFQILSRDPLYRNAISCYCLPVLRYLLFCSDPDTLANTAAAISCLAESIDCRKNVSSTIPILDIIPLLKNENVEVCREASRAISNVLSSAGIHSAFIRYGLSASLRLCQDPDKECQYNATLMCRKIVVNKASHAEILNQVSGLMTLASCGESKTRNLALTTIRDLSANACNRHSLVKKNAVTILISLLDHSDHITKTLVTATLRHLSSDQDLQAKIMADDIIIKAASLILGASTDFLSQLAGLLANLSEDDGNRCRMVKLGVISALAVLSRARSVDILLVSIKRNTVSLFSRYLLSTTF